MIVREVSLRVPAERRADFTSFWRNEYAPAMSGMAGFVSARLLAPQGGSDELLMVLEFDSEEKAAAWRASPEHARLGPRLKEYSPVIAVRVLMPIG